MTVPDNETSGAEIQGPRGWRGLRIGKRSRSFSSPTTLSDPGAVLGYIVCKIFAVEGALEKVKGLERHPDFASLANTLCYNSRDSPWWEYRVTVNIPAEILNKIDMFGLVVAHCAITWGRSCLQCYAPNQPLDLWSSASDSLNILSQMACLWGDKDRCGLEECEQGTLEAAGNGWLWRDDSRTTSDPFLSALALANGALNMLLATADNCIP
ncbi:hypothetical protein BD309DRAFT_984554 [Dichomitus squalens]|nr:hypothetical protein BD309DRAFT_984554 [Dichomitus squalens]